MNRKEILDLQAQDLHAGQMLAVLTSLQSLPFVNEKRSNAINTAVEAATVSIAASRNASIKVAAARELRDAHNVAHDIAREALDDANVQVLKLKAASEVLNVLGDTNVKTVWV